MSNVIHWVVADAAVSGHQLLGKRFKLPWQHAVLSGSAGFD